MSRFLYLAIHHPKPQHVEDLLGAMRKFGQVLKATPGVLDVSAWRALDGERIVAISIWESQEAFKQALPTMAAAVANVPFDEWEARPRELIQLNEADA